MLGMSLNVLLAFLAVSPTARLMRGLFDDTFAGIHQMAWFDWAMLVPYFTVLIVLSVYGIHRYEVIRTYFKHRKNVTDEAPLSFEHLPPITIQLPIYNERYVVERLIEEVVKVEYPKELLQIQVLDDSVDDTAPFAEALVEQYRALGYPIEYHHRADRHGFKAGALQEGLQTATGEFVAIFDADFCPPPDFLYRTVHHFADPKVGVVQTRWSYLNRDYNFLTEVEAMLLDGHFILEHGARSRAGYFFNFNGTAGMLRKSMITDAGGWQHDTLTEDTDLSYRAQLRGWKFIYDPKIECPSELPVEMNAFKAQQARWAKGLIQVAKKLLPTIWRSDQPLKIKLEATFHLTANIAYPLMVLFALILLPAMIVRFYQGWFQMLYLDLPLFLASTCSVSTFYMVSQRDLYPREWRQRIKYIPFLMATGIGLSLGNAKVVIEALCGVKSEFVRTPKYRIEEREEGWEHKKYVRRRAGWTPAMELAFAAYFLWNIAYSFTIQNYLTTPFLMLFFMGYSYMGTMSLLQTPLRRLWNAVPSLVRSRPLSAET